MLHTRENADTSTENADTFTTREDIYIYFFFKRKVNFLFILYSKESYVPFFLGVSRQIVPFQCVYWV